MAKFLFTAWPFAGHLHPNIAIAHALKEEGNEVGFYTGSKVADKIREEGFEHFPFEKVDEEKIETLVFSQHKVPSLVRNPFQLIALYRGWLLDTIPGQVDDLKRVLSSWQPDLIVCDPTFWGPVLILHDTQPIPVAISSFLPGCMIPGPDAPPWGIGLPRPKNWHSRIIARTVEAVSNFLLTRFRRSINELRRRYQLSDIPGSAVEYTGQMPLHLIPSVPELDYQRHDLPPCVQYVGPCVWNKARNEPAPNWLAQMKKDRPWVHITEGTMHSQDPFVLQAGAQGLANLPYEVIMTTGKNRDPLNMKLGPIASNIKVKRWVPHSDLLPLTDVMVTTGGGSTVLAGLTEGVPMVIVPTQWDKPDNAQRVVEAGAGVRISPRQCTPKRLRKAVEQVLNNGSYRENAKRLASVFNRYGGAHQAAKLLTNLCGAK